MDYQELTDVFWENVDRMKQAQRLSWAYISKKTGHPAGSLSTAKYMKRMPSIGLALSIAKVLGTTVEELCGIKTDDGRSRTLRDVLYNVTDGLNEINMVNLISFAEMMRQTQAEEYPDGVNLAAIGSDSELGRRTLGEKVEHLKAKYLGPEKAETDGEDDRK